MYVPVVNFKSATTVIRIEKTVILYCKTRCLVPLNVHSHDFNTPAGPFLIAKHYEETNFTTVFSIVKNINNNIQRDIVLGLVSWINHISIFGALAGVPEFCNGCNSNFYGV